MLAFQLGGNTLLLGLEQEAEEMQSSIGFGCGRAAANNEEKDAHHWIYIEFASRRAHRNNMDARRDFFVAEVI